MKLTLFADHHQVHLLDDRDGTDLTDAWSAQATDDRLAAAPGIIGIGTEAADDVSVELKVLTKAPPADLAKWQHVTSGSIEVTTGRLVAMGCTEYLPDAKRLKLKPGVWALRISHKGLGRREQVRVQLWPGAAAAPRVEKRYVAPAPKPPKPVKAAKNAKAAAALAREGRTAEALEALLRFAGEGDGAAAASAAVLLAYQGRWAEVVPHALALLKNPAAVYAGNVFDDLGALINRCAVELKDPALVARAAAVVPPAMAPRTKAVILDNVVPRLATGAPDRTRFDAAVADATNGKRFKGKPDVLALHCFALAQGFNVDDELLARYDPTRLNHTFDHVLAVARVHARRKSLDAAWAVLEAQLRRWWPMDTSQVAPVELLVDPLLAPLMTPERCAKVLATPRGPEGRP
ncbi:MAG: hypothetical protein JNK82_44640 [Myxococcaceae bacterium]|nr:hypothetical protein [Myxococcaceae bacterium]